MYIFQFHHYIKPEMIEAYKAASIENARQTVLEAGILRFEVFQDVKDPGHFSLLEVYRDLQAREYHLQTAHFLQWKEVALQAFDHRGQGEEYNPIFPAAEVWQKA